MLHSGNDGVSWQAQTSGTTQGLDAVWGSGPGDVFAVGANGAILHRNDPEPSLLPDPVFYVQTDGSLYQQTGSTRTLVSWAGSILSVTSVTDGAGQAVAFAITAGNHNLWEHSAGLPGNHWTRLSGGYSLSASTGLDAGGQAVVYGVLSDASLWENDPAFVGNGGWLNLWPAGTTLSVGAGGADEVFAIRADQTLWQHSPSGWTEPSGLSFQSVSGNAGAADIGEVFGVLTDGSLWEYRLPFVGAGAWTQILGSGGQSASAPLLSAKTMSVRPPAYDYLQ